MITQIKTYLRSLGYSEEACRIVISQAAHESNGFTSKLFNESFNMFGMKAHGRKVAGKIDGENNVGYATYRDIKGSINDIVDWHRRTRAAAKIENLIEYVNFLKEKKYFEDSLNNYLNGCLYWYNQYFSESVQKYQ